MLNRGKLIIGLIVGTALVAASFAWWYTYRQGQRVLELWGAEAAYRIRLAPECTLLELVPATADQPADLETQTGRWQIVRQRSVADAPGFVHARQALINDASYDWTAPRRAIPPQPQGQYALRFRDPSGETLLLFDLDQHQVVDLHQQRRADIAPIASGLQTYFRQQLSGDASAVRGLH